MVRKVADRGDPSTWPHGRASTYNNLGCRCDECKAAASQARKNWIASLQDRPFDEVPHGTESGYRNWACRCEECRYSHSQRVRSDRVEARWKEIDDAETEQDPFRF